MLILLAIVSGLASGLLFETDYYIVPGVLFAIAVVIGSRMRFQKVGILRVLGFIGLSVLANFAAVRCALLTSDAGLTDTLKDIAIGASGGLVGSLLLSFALALIFRMKLARTMIAVCCAGTAAGALFMLMPHAAVSYPIWQGAVAAAIAWVWRNPR